MENIPYLGSQENFPSSTALSTDGEEPTSSPVLPLAGKQHGSKQRKPPTITPRSFTRFFTPKSSLERGGRIGASREALRDITAQASNRRRRRTPTKDTIQLYDEGSKDTADTAARKRRKLDSVDVTPERSSPLKRIRNQSLETSDEESDADQAASGDEIQKILEKTHRPCRRILKAADPILDSGYRHGLGRDLRREIGAFGRSITSRSSTRGFGGSKDWEHETANFCTRPEDVHICYNVAMPSDHSIPFCTASCNSESSNFGKPFSQ